MKQIVTIICPFYNVEKFIKRCIESVLNQTYQHIELILIDDCGVDSSLDIVKSLVLNNTSEKSVRLISHEHNKGVGEARNTGIQYSTGDYLFFLDSDDFLFPYSIELLVDLSNRNMVDVVGGSYQITDSGQDDFRIYSGMYYGEEVIKAFYYLKKWDCVCWNLLIKTSVIKDHYITFPQLKYSEDVFFLFQLYLHVKSILLIPDITYVYEKNQTSITNTETMLSKIKSSEKAYDLMLSYFRQYSNKSVYVVSFMNDYRLYLIAFYIQQKYRLDSLSNNLFVPIISSKYMFRSKLSLKNKLKNYIFETPDFLKKQILRLTL